MTTWLRLLSFSLVAASMATPACAQDRREREEDGVVYSGRLTRGGMLTIKNIMGNISVTGTSSDRVEVRATKRAGGNRDPRDVTFDVEESTSGTRICTVYRGQSACEDGSFNNVRVNVNYTVSLPRGVRLRAATGNGELSVERSGSDVDVRTGNGAIRVSETEGGVFALTGNGEIEVDGARGPVRATSGGGAIFVSTSTGPVIARTGNGGIDVRMKALGGDSDMDFRTGSGAIRVTVPSDLNAELDATTGSGDLQSDFEIRVMGRLNPQHIRGTIGSGGPTIRLQSGSGRLELRKGG